MDLTKQSYRGLSMLTSGLSNIIFLNLSGQQAEYGAISTISSSGITMEQVTTAYYGAHVVQPNVCLVEKSEVPSSEQLVNVKSVDATITLTAIQTREASQPQPVQVITVKQEPKSEDMVYVNPRQFYRIVRRRAAKEKMVREGRIPPPGEKRKAFLYNSRHCHAMRRKRMDDGKFHRDGMFCGNAPKFSHEVIIEDENRNNYYECLGGPLHRSERIINKDKDKSME